MRNIFFAAALFCLPAMTVAQSQPQERIEKCSMVVLQKTETLLNNDIPGENVLDFLLTFSQSCNNDGSYTSLSNRLLFDLLDQHTEKLLAVMASNEMRIDMSSVLYNFSHPRNTSFDIPALVTKTENAQNGGGLRSTIAAQLKKSMEKTPGRLD